MANNDAKTGRFTAGNKAARGNPYTRKAAAMRKALYNSVTADDMRRIVDVLKEQALAGDLKAITVLFDRILGTAQTGIDLLERLEKLEGLLDDADGKGGGNAEY
jgi:tetrahydromethanopterin S-methyltransferase subunit H